MGKNTFSIQVQATFYNYTYGDPNYHTPLDKMAAILAYDIFKRILDNENDRIPFQISLKFVPGDPIDNSPALV